MKLINLTPHAVDVFQGNVSTISFPSAGSIRLVEIDDKQQTLVLDDAVHGIPVVQRTYAGGELPDEQDGIGYIVSNLVAAAFPERRDLFYPAADVRDGTGKIIGTTKLCQVPQKGAESGEDPFDFPQYATAKKLFPDAKG